MDKPATAGSLAGRELLESGKRGLAIGHSELEAEARDQEVGIYNTGRHYEASRRTRG